MTILKSFWVINKVIFNMACPIVVLIRNSRQLKNKLAEMQYYFYQMLA